MSRKSKHNNRRNGTSAVEFAMIMPVFVIVIIGAMELCNLNVSKSIIINKAREAARLAINTNADGDAIAATTQSQIASMLRVQPGDITVTLSATAPGGTPRSSFQQAKKGDLVEVKVAFPYAKIAFFASSFMGTSLTVADSCIMQKE